MTKEEFLSTLTTLVESNGTQQQLKQLITDYGSETPDNLEAGKHLEFVERNQYRGVGSHNHLLSDVLNTLECTELPPYIKEEFPDLSQKEWESLLRMATLIASAMETRIKPE